MFYTNRKKSDYGLILPSRCRRRTKRTTLRLRHPLPVSTPGIGGIHTLSHDHPSGSLFIPKLGPPRIAHLVIRHVRLVIQHLQPPCHSSFASRKEFNAASTISCFDRRVVYISVLILSCMPTGSRMVIACRGTTGGRGAIRTGTTLAKKAARGWLRAAGCFGS